jgi:hypothetical protein
MNSITKNYGITFGGQGEINAVLIGLIALFALLLIAYVIRKEERTGWVVYKAICSCLTWTAICSFFSPLPQIAMNTFEIMCGLCAIALVGLLIIYTLGFWKWLGSQVVMLFWTVIGAVEIGITSVLDKIINREEGVIPAPTTAPAKEEVLTLSEAELIKKKIEYLQGRYEQIQEMSYPRFLSFRTFLASEFLSTFSEEKELVTFLEDLSSTHADILIAIEQRIDQLQGKPTEKTSDEKVDYLGCLYGLIDETSPEEFKTERRYLALHLRMFLGDEYLLWEKVEDPMIITRMGVMDAILARIAELNPPPSEPEASVAAEPVQSAESIDVLNATGDQIDRAQVEIEEEAIIKTLAASFKDTLLDPAIQRTEAEFNTSVVGLLQVAENESARVKEKLALAMTGTPAEIEQKLTSIINGEITI